jgi:hypothetical protein
MFYSILFPIQEKHEQPRRSEVPGCFKDLNLDQIFAPILKSKKNLNWKAFSLLLWTTRKSSSIAGCHAELEDDSLRSQFIAFPKTVYDLGRYMETIKKSLSSGSSYDNNYLARGRMLDYADRYCREVTALAAD